MNRREKYCASLLAFVLLFAIASASRAAEQYKNQTRNAISNIVNNKLDASTQDKVYYLKTTLGVAQSTYGLTVAYA